MRCTSLVEVVQMCAEASVISLLQKCIATQCSPTQKLCMAQQLTKRSKVSVDMIQKLSALHGRDMCEYLYLCVSKGLAGKVFVGTSPGLEGISGACISRQALGPSCT
jgi:hypothetical protein